MLRNWRLISIIFIALLFLIIILCYFFWPKTYKISDNVQITINTNTSDIVLNEQEVRDFVKLFNKSKLYHGYSKPVIMLGENKPIFANISGLKSGPICFIIYHDTYKTYTYAYTGNNFYERFRISNEKEIRKFFENIVNNTESEKVQ